MTPIWSVVGQQGGGKTYFLALMGLEEPQFQDRLIYSNCWIDSKRYKEVEWEDLKNIPNGSLVFFDELNFWLEVRISGYWFNAFLTRYFNTSRKRNVDVFGTYQLGRMIDVRILEQTRYLVKCERIDNGNPDYEKWDFRFTILDLWKDTITPLRLLYEDATPLFPRFKSYELPQGLHDKRDSWRLAKLGGKKAKGMLLKVINQLEPILKKIDKFSIKTALVLTDNPLDMCDDIYSVLTGKIDLEKLENYE